MLTTHWGSFSVTTKKRNEKITDQECRIKRRLTYISNTGPDGAHHHLLLQTYYPCNPSSENSTTESQRQNPEVILHFPQVTSVITSLSNSSFHPLSLLLRSAGPQPSLLGSSKIQLVIFSGLLSARPLGMEHGSACSSAGSNLSFLIPLGNSFLPEIVSHTLYCFQSPI